MGYEPPLYEGEDAKDRVAIKDLFEMISGTSTGSIITAGLTYTDKSKGLLDTKGKIPAPGFWAKNLKDMYIREAGTIFATHKK